MSLNRQTDIVLESNKRYLFIPKLCVHSFKRKCKVCGSALSLFHFLPLFISLHSSTESPYKSCLHMPRFYKPTWQTGISTPAPSQASTFPACSARSPLIHHVLSLLSLSYMPTVSTWVASTSTSTSFCQPPTPRSPHPTACLLVSHHVGQHAVNTIFFVLVLFFSAQPRLNFWSQLGLGPPYKVLDTLNGTWQPMTMYHLLVLK